MAEFRNCIKFMDSNPKDSNGLKRLKSKNIGFIPFIKLKNVSLTRQLKIN